MALTVLGAKSRSFGDVYSRAQEILRKTFGMELVELRARGEAEDATLQREKEAMGVKKKGEFFVMLCMSDTSSSIFVS